MKFLIILSLVLCSAKLSLSDTLDLNELVPEIIEGISTFASNNEKIAGAASTVGQGDVRKLLKNYSPALDTATLAYMSNANELRSLIDDIQNAKIGGSAHGWSELGISSNLLNAIEATMSNVASLFATFAPVMQQISDDIAKLVKTAVIENGVFKINYNFISETIKLQVDLYSNHAKLLALENAWLRQLQKTQAILDKDFEANYVPAYVVHSIRGLITQGGDGMENIEDNIFKLIHGLENLPITIKGTTETIPTSQFVNLVEGVEQANAAIYRSMADFATQMNEDLKGIIKFMKSQ